MALAMNNKDINGAIKSDKDKMLGLLPKAILTDSDQPLQKNHEATSATQLTIDANSPVWILAQQVDWTEIHAESIHATGWLRIAMIRPVH